MPAGSLLALLDDIAATLDDVATMTKVATKKTAGVLGDDLALNAEQVTGLHPDRELPVVWKVAKGSAVNKLILVPAALGISAVAPWVVTPLLMLGGAYLCYEGFEKVTHKLLHKGDESKAVKAAAPVDPQELERDKVKGAIRTDFVLSAEIIVIALGTVATAPFQTRMLVVSAIAVLMTIGVYGLVAGIVKLDDLGLALRDKASAVARGIGNGILKTAPYLMKTLSVAGTVAMFLVGGGIVTHGIPGLHSRVDDWEKRVGTAGVVLPSVVDALTGVLVGGVVLAVVGAVRRVALRSGPAAG